VHEHLEARRYLGRGAHHAAGSRRRLGFDHLGRAGRLHRRPGAPAHRRRPAQRKLRREPPDGILDVEPNDHGLGRSCRPSFESSSELILPYRKCTSTSGNGQRVDPAAVLACGRPHRG
jgi:hypothetical protein